jgi:hypothetical protein
MQPTRANKLARLALTLFAAALACNRPAAAPRGGVPSTGEPPPPPPTATQTAPAVSTGSPTSPAVPAIMPYIPTPTPTLAHLGEIQPIPEGGYVYLGDPAEMALGFNMDAGGAIGSLFYRGVELVDDTDFGRYIQISPYDGDDVYIGGGLQIDSIRLETRCQVLDFYTAEDAAGIQAVNQLEDLAVAAGSLQLRSTGTDPYFHLPLQSTFEAEDTPQIEIRMNVSAGFIAQLFFAPEGGVISEENSLVFEIVPGGQFHTYIIDLASVPTWTGRIRDLRLDPSDSVAEIEVDYILILSSP